MLTKNNQPLPIGSTIHFKGKPFFIFSANQVSGYINLISMDESRQFLTVFPAQIGAAWQH